MPYLADELGDSAGEAGAAGGRSGRARSSSTRTREQMDLIVMPTHGYGPFRRFILGSVTAKVLHDADCPVMTGVHLEEAPPIDTIAFRHVLVAVDLGPQSAPALRMGGLVRFGLRRAALAASRHTFDRGAVRRVLRSRVAGQPGRGGQEGDRQAHGRGRREARGPDRGRRRAARGLHGGRSVWEPICW